MPAGLCRTIAGAAASSSQPWLLGRYVGEVAQMAAKGQPMLKVLQCRCIAYVLSLLRVASPVKGCIAHTYAVWSVAKGASIPLRPTALSAAARPEGQPSSNSADARFALQMSDSAKQDQQMKQVAHAAPIQAAMVRPRGLAAARGPRPLIHGLWAAHLLGRLRTSCAVERPHLHRDRARPAPFRRWYRIDRGSSACAGTCSADSGARRADAGDSRSSDRAGNGADSDARGRAYSGDRDA
jgi:hypothetical protein